MAQKSNNAVRKPFNFGESPLVKTTEQTVTEGYDAIENNVSQPLSEDPLHVAAEKGGRSINIELPLALHTRLKIACASQNRKIKDIVPEIIAGWVEQVEKR